MWNLPKIFRGSFENVGSLVSKYTLHGVPETSKPLLYLLRHLSRYFYIFWSTLFVNNFSCPIFIRKLIKRSPRTNVSWRKTLTTHLSSIANGILLLTSCVMSRQLKASHWWYVICNKLCLQIDVLYHAEIIYEQNVSEIVKISQQMAKLCRK